MARVEWRFEPRLDQLRVARAALRAWFEARGLSRELTSDAVLVISELVTNGVIHNGHGPITVRAEDREAGIMLEVITVDHPTGQAPSWPRRDPAEGGHGLHIVEALTEDYAVSRDGPRRTVSCRLLPDVAPA
jgi:anti-sigma regulatory factor (Ser/Thr protein kinase)